MAYHLLSLITPPLPRPRLITGDVRALQLHYLLQYSQFCVFTPFSFILASLWPLCDPTIEQFVKKGTLCTITIIFATRLYIGAVRALQLHYLLQYPRFLFSTTFSLIFAPFMTFVRSYSLPICHEGHNCTILIVFAPDYSLVKSTSVALFSSIFAILCFSLPLASFLAVLWPWVGTSRNGMLYFYYTNPACLFMKVQAVIYYHFKRKFGKIIKICLIFWLPRVKVRHYETSNI